MPDPPKPRRMARPRWLDFRVIGGVLLLVSSVVVGVRVISASSRTSPVWVAAHDLAAGTVLASGDVVAAQVNLGERGESYLDASSPLAGRMLNRSVRGGELVPVSVVEPVGDGRVVSIAVMPERMAPDVAHGSVIDLYLTSGRTALSGGEVRTWLLQSGVTVQSVTAPASGGLSAATSSRYQVALMLSPLDADALVRDLAAGEPVVVLRTGAAADSGYGSSIGAAPPGPAPPAGMSTEDSSRPDAVAAAGPGSSSPAPALEGAAAQSESAGAQASDPSDARGSGPAGAAQSESAGARASDPSGAASSDQSAARPSDVTRPPAPEGG